MVNLLRRLRGLTQVGTAQYTLGTVTWWGDDQLQEVLDAFRVDVNFYEMRAQPDVNPGGTVQYFQYYTDYTNLEENTSGTIYFQIEDGTGSAVGTANYSVDYISGLTRFNADRGGTVYYLRARSYNILGAAAQIWREMAGNVAAFYSFQTDNQKFTRSDWFTHCMQLADGYDAQGGISSGVMTVRMARTDLRSAGQAWHDDRGWHDNVG